jgi:hypothetical protein
MAGPSFALFSAAFALLLVGSACGSSSEGSSRGDGPLEGGDGLAFAACASQHVAPNADGDTVIQCDQPFASSPRVHLPADDTAGAVVTVYAAIDGQDTAVLRDGRRLAFMDDQGASISFHDPTHDRHGSLPAGLRMPSNRGMYLVYRLTGTFGQATPPFGTPVPAIHVLSGAPVVMLPGQVIDGAMVGVWEGTTGARNPDGSFTTEELPLRVRFSDKAPTKSLDAWDPDTPLADGAVFKLTGEIENYVRSVRGSDGKCYPALTSLGDKNPFHGAPTGAVDAYRMTGMHTQGDQWVVLTVPVGATSFSVTTMSPLGPFAPSDWIATGAGAALALKPHGLNGSRIPLHRVDSAAGGDSC